MIAPDNASAAKQGVDWQRLQAAYDTYRIECPKHKQRRFLLEAELSDAGLRYRGVFASGDPDNAPHEGPWVSTEAKAFDFLIGWEKYLIG